MSVQSSLAADKIVGNITAGAKPPDPTPSPAHQRLANAKAARAIAIPMVAETIDQLQRLRSTLQRQEATEAELKQTNADVLAARVREALHSGDLTGESMLTSEVLESGNAARHKVEVASAMAAELRKQLPAFESRHQQTTASLARVQEELKAAALAVIEEDAHRIADEIQPHVDAIQALRMRLMGAIQVLSDHDYGAQPTGQLYGGGYGATPQALMAYPKIYALNDRLDIPDVKFDDNTKQQAAEAFRAQLIQLIIEDK